MASMKMMKLALELQLYVLLAVGNSVCHLPLPHMNTQPSCQGNSCSVTCVSKIIRFQCNETFDIDALCRRIICQHEETTACSCVEDGIDCLVSNDPLPNGLPLFPRLELFGAFSNFQDFESFLPIIKHYPMKTLHLHYFQLDSLANKTFPGTLRDLETLHLYNCRIRGKTKFDYPCLPKLQTLALITAALDSFDLQQFPCSFLKHLILDNNQITELSGSCLGTPSATSLQSLRMLHWLTSYQQKPLDLRGLSSLQYLEIERISALELADVRLPQFNSLLGIKLSGSQIRSFGYDDLYHAINFAQINSRNEGSGPLTQLFRSFTISDNMTCVVRNPTLSYKFNRGDVLECNCQELGLKNVPFCPSVRQIACPTGGQTFQPSQACDGHVDCSDGHDESYCNLSGTVAGSPPCFDLFRIQCMDTHLELVEVLTHDGVMNSLAYKPKDCTLRPPIRTVMTGTNTFEGTYGTAPVV